MIKSILCMKYGTTVVSSIMTLYSDITLFTRKDNCQCSVNITVARFIEIRLGTVHFYGEFPIKNTVFFNSEGTE